jgi:hemolysin activation/secretion protein
LRHEFALSVTGERLQSRTSLLGEGFEFSPGAEDGVATDTALRFTAEWLDRTQNQVIALRSRFSLGIDALGATIHDDSNLPDGRFLVWLGQVQWGRRLPFRDVQLLFRLDAQFTTDPLLPLEQIAVGGRFSVRGYRENTLVRDNGVIVSLEARIPLIQNVRWAEVLQVVPFADFGAGWNQHVPTPDPTRIGSIGLGLRWTATWQTFVPLRTQVEVFWGYPLKKVDTEGGDLQDHGLHLQCVVAAF